MKRLILIVSAIAMIACGKKPESEATSAAPTAASGEALFTEKGCATCHGVQGKGDGPVGAALKPKPRNFADAKWKYGFDLATVIKTISNGSPGTGMAPYKGVLTDDEIKAVAEHVRKLGGKN